MIHFKQEHLMTLAEAAKSLPGKVHPSTIFRWTRQGVRGTTLDSIVVGGRRYTSAEAVERFVESTTTGCHGPEPVRGSRQRERAIQDAELELGLEPRECLDA